MFSFSFGQLTVKCLEPSEPISFIIVHTYVCVCDEWDPCGGQGTLSRVSYLLLLGILGIKLRLATLLDKCLYLLIHLAGQ